MKVSKEVLDNAGLHHTSWTRGYTSRLHGESGPVPYKGRFGEGYTTLSPSWESSMYCHINYYIV